MTDDTFSQKIEWKLHKFIIAFNFMICVAALVTKSLNSRPNGKFCSLAAVPAGCRQSPDIYGECDENIASNTTILAYAMNFTNDTRFFKDKDFRDYLYELEDF